MLPRRLLWRGLLALGAIVFTAGAARYFGYQLDDTFISFRYARNLVEGHGLVFNPGERVEGYTNLLFVLIAAAFMVTGLDPLVPMQVVTALSAVAALLLSSVLVRRILTVAGRDDETCRRAATWTSCLLLTYEGFAYWSMVAMETMLFTALLTAAVLLLVLEGYRGRGHLSALAFVLLALTRPEGAYAAAVAIGAAAVVEWRRHGDLRGPRRLIATGALAGAGIAGLFACRLAYYGSLLPNTFYAKVTGGEEQISTGLRYLRDWILASPLPAVAVLAPVLLVMPRFRARVARGNSMWILWAVVAAFALNAAAVGGDSMPFFRFLIHVLPLACALVVLAGEGLLDPSPGRVGSRRIVAVLVPLALLFGAVASHVTVQPYRAFVAHRTAVVGAAVGRWFGATLPEKALMAVNTIGTLPWESRLPTVDMLGLTDPEIAHRPVYVSSTGWSGHRRGWGAYVLDRRPAAILWYNSAGSAEPFYLGDRELAEDPGFRFFYRHRVEQLQASGENGEQAPVIARFLGHPFGYHVSGFLDAPELGVRAGFPGGGVARTLLRERPITLHWFEPDPRDAELWPLRRRHAADVGAFVNAVADTWIAAGNGTQPFEVEARMRVEALCNEALRQIEAGDLEGARRALSRAAARNKEARSPIVYQYMANVAVMTGDLLAALPAQKEALRLAPENRLYAENLENLLERPWHYTAP